MPLRSFSDPHRGLFITVDGPSGAGKSTSVAHLARLLISAGEQVHTTAEPSSSMVGTLAREATERVTGPALACLYAADRYHHLDSEIRPHLAEGILVLCDRYVPSGLVMQRFDGVDPSFLWTINALAERPDLAVILEADPAVIAARLTERGPRNRFQALPGSAHGEAHFYRQACDRLIQAGYDVLRIDAGERTPDQVAAIIVGRLAAFSAAPPSRPGQEEAQS
jgi:dTMP kinase